MTATVPHLIEKKSWLQLAGIAIAVAAMAVCLVIDIPGLEPVGVRMLGIFIAAIALWVTEAVPLAATGMGIILAEVLLLSDDAVLPVPEDPTTAATFFATLANPVIILFMGGFFIADGAAKYGLDKNLAAVMLRPFRGSARLTMLGLMAITALLSMFMSNTATTATMFAVVVPILETIKDKRTRAGIALSIPLAANLGGVGTPVGSPPNAIAVGVLAENGIRVTFVEWMILAVPFMLLMLAAGWLLLALLFVRNAQPITLELTTSFQRSRRAVLFYVIAGFTVLMWMSEPLHGISSNTVGFIPIAAMLATGVMDGRDVQNLSWPVLWLVAGGIALGIGLGSTGLDRWLLEGVSWESLGALAFMFAVGLVAAVMSTFLSNSASANLLVPLVLGPGIAAAAGDVQLAVVVALGCALGLALPISTPPNAIAYSTGHVPQTSMILTGAILSPVGAVLLAFVIVPLWTLLGLV